MWKMLAAITLSLCVMSCSSEAPPVTPDPLEGCQATGETGSPSLLVKTRHARR